MEKNTNGQTYLYDVFISYRHNDRDSAIAESLLTLLEQIRRKDCPRLHVFRDRDELPTSSNLGDGLREALRASRFLVLLCSPEYLESKWCREELLYFRELHGNRNENVLPLLVAGEPEEAFPKELFTQEVSVVNPDGTVGTQLQEVEPLGADVRADSTAESLKKLKSTEYMRIAAPVLGLRFDDLYQREQRRLRKRLRRLLAGVTASACVMIGFLSWQLFRVSQSKLHEKAIYAQQLFDDGDRLRARRESKTILEEYLPAMDDSIQEAGEKLQFLTSFTPEFSVLTHITPKLSDHTVFFDTAGETIWEYSSTAASQYDLEANLLRSFQLGKRGLKICTVSPDGTRAVLLCRSEEEMPQLELWNLESWEPIQVLLSGRDYSRTAYMQAQFSPDGKVVSACNVGGDYNGNERLTLFDAATGETVCALDGALAGTFQDDGVQDRVVSGFAFLNSDTAYWEGGAYHVFYSISQDAYWQVPNGYSGKLSRTRNTKPVFGRFVLTKTEKGLTLTDLADMDRSEQFKVFVEDPGWKAVSYTQYGASMVLARETVETDSGESILSSACAIDVLDGTARASVEGLESYGWYVVKVLSQENTDVVYLLLKSSEDVSQNYLMRMDPRTGDTRLVPLDPHFQNMVLLGCLGERNYFAAEYAGEAALLCEEPGKPIRFRRLNTALSSLTDAFQIAQCGDRARLIAEYQGDYCLFSLDPTGTLLDASGTDDRNDLFSVSEDGSHWMRVSFNSWSADTCPDRMVLQEKIHSFGTSNSGRTFAACSAELRVYQSDGTLQTAMTPAEGKEICSAKMSDDGRYLFWLESDLITSLAQNYKTCTLFSLDLETLQKTEYSIPVYWGSTLPVEDVYDCAPDGRYVGYIAAKRELVLMDVDQASYRKALFSDVLPQPDTGYTGFCFLDQERILCVGGSSMTAFRLDPLQPIFSALETSAYTRMPELLDEHTLVYFGSNLDFWDLDTGEFLHAIPAGGNSTVIPAKNRQWFLTSDPSGSRLYRIKDWSQGEVLRSGGGRFHYLSDSCAIFNDGQHLYRWDFSES